MLKPVMMRCAQANSTCRIGLTGPDKLAAISRMHRW